MARPRTPPVINPQAYAPTVWQDGVTPVNAANLNKLEQGLAAAVGIPADVVVAPATALLIRNRLNAADTQPAFRLLADGRQEWGAGGAAAADVALWRSGPGVISTGKLSILGMDSQGPVNVLVGAGAAILTGAAPGDTAYRLVMSVDGTMYLGPGSAPADTNLYRSGAQTLKTDGSLSVSQTIYAGAGQIVNNISMLIQAGAEAAGANGIRWLIRSHGHMEWGPGDGTLDTNLYRVGANSLQTNGNLAVGLTLNAGTLGAPGAGWAFYTYGQGDVGVRFLLLNDGKMQWGNQAGNVMDTNLYRSAAGVLATDGNLQIAGAWLINAGTIAGGGNADFRGATNVYLSGGAGKVMLRNDNTAITMQPDGKLAFSYLEDTNLYRAAAGYLKTDTAFVAGQGVYVGNGADYTTAQFGIHFGLSDDTNLYRSMAGQLKTDGGFVALGFVAGGIGGAAGSMAFVTNVVGDAVNRFLLDNTGAMQWGPGPSAPDTSLARLSPGVLGINGVPIATGASTTPRIATVGFNTPVNHNTQGAWQLLAWDVEFGSTGGVWNPATPTRLTAPVAGFYAVAARVQFGSNTNGLGIQIQNQAGTVLAQILQVQQGNAGEPRGCQLYDTFHFNAGEYIVMWVYQNWSGGIPISGGLSGSRLTMSLIAPG